MCIDMVEAKRDDRAEAMGHCNSMHAIEGADVLWMHMVVVT